MTGGPVPLVERPKTGPEEEAGRFSGRPFHLFGLGVASGDPRPASGFPAGPLRAAAHFGVASSPDAGLRDAARGPEGS